MAAAGSNTQERSWTPYLQGRVLDPDARIVAVGSLVVNPKNRDNDIEDRARREASLPIPAACLT